MATKVTIDGHVFIVSPDQDVDEVKRNVRKAVQDGGELVTFQIVGNTPVSVLVSKGVPVLFETTEPVPQDHSPNPDDAQYFSEYYGYDE